MITVSSCFIDKNHIAYIISYHCQLIFDVAFPSKSSQLYPSSQPPEPLWDKIVGQDLVGADS